MSNFGAILASTREYVNGRHDPPGLTMNLRRLYIGGLPSHVIAPSLTNRYVASWHEGLKWKLEALKASARCTDIIIEVVLFLPPK